MHIPLTRLCTCSFVPHSCKKYVKNRGGSRCEVDVLEIFNWLILHASRKQHGVLEKFALKARVHCL